MNNLAIIAARGKNNELGINNNLIWHLQEDLKFFRNTTINSNIIMGYNTFRSLPKMLPKRKHLVLTHKTLEENENLIVFHSIADILEYIKLENKTSFVIGGASIYKQFIDLVNIMYLTNINAECKNAEVFFPNFNQEDWNQEVLAKHNENNIDYEHVLYTRILRK